MLRFFFLMKMHHLFFFKLISNPKEADIFERGFNKSLVKLSDVEQRRIKKPLNVPITQRELPRTNNRQLSFSYALA